VLKFYYLIKSEIYRHKNKTLCEYHYITNYIQFGGGNSSSIFLNKEVLENKIMSKYPILYNFSVKLIVFVFVLKLIIENKFIRTYTF
jgi:hypothetical protein